MIVWRVEKNGKGPYRKEWSGKEKLITDHSDYKRYNHPTPRDTGSLDSLAQQLGYDWEWQIPKNLIFLHGCRSLGELKKWFRGWWGMMHKAGFRVVVYRVDVWEEDDYQVVFMKKGAKRVAEYSMMRRNDKIYAS